MINFCQNCVDFSPKTIHFFLFWVGGGGATKSTHLRVLWAFKRNYAYAPLAHKNEDKITKNI